MTIVPWISAAALAALLSSAHLLDGPKDWEAEKAMEQSMLDAIEQEKAQQGYVKAVQSLCGVNGAWIQLEDGLIQCYTHKGKKTVQVKLEN